MSVWRAMCCDWRALARPRLGFHRCFHRYLMTLLITQIQGGEGAVQLVVLLFAFASIIFQQTRTTLSQV